MAILTHKGDSLDSENRIEFQCSLIMLEHPWMLPIGDENIEHIFNRSSLEIHSCEREEGEENKKSKTIPNNLITINFSVPRGFSSEENLESWLHDDFKLKNPLSKIGENLRTLHDLEQSVYFFHPIECPVCDNPEKYRRTVLDKLIDSVRRVKYSHTIADEYNIELIERQLIEQIRNTVSELYTLTPKQLNKTEVKELTPGNNSGINAEMNA